MKKVISILLAIILVAGVTIPALAVEPYEQRVVVGADLNASEKAQVYADFGLEQGAVEEITVTISEEKAYLEEYVSASAIGSRSMSSVYIITKEAGEGLDITINNINWLTEDIYRNALTTAGITDAKVIITAPVAVSGTAALTGIYKAYEEITGEDLDETAKLAAVQEAVITGDLAAELGDDEDIAQLVNQLKLIMDEIKLMTDDEVRTEINNIAIELNITLTSDQVEQLLTLCRSLQDVDLGAFQGVLETIAGSLGTLSSVGEAASGFFASVVEFFSNIGSAISDFFSNLFGR